MTPPNLRAGSFALQGMAGRAYIGTSGWQYKGWKESWYANAPLKTWLESSASRFTGLEADGTFYRLQKKETYEDWARRTPPDFRFAIRGHRYSTHRKRLLDAEATIDKQKEPADGLGEKLGAVIWQLPPFMKIDLARLETFLQALDKLWPVPRHSFEFRHESWFNSETAALLSRYRIANCISDAGKWARWDAVTTDMVYVRLHGKPHTYWSGYSAEDLDEWAAKVKQWLAEDRDVHVYFDNDAQGLAPFDASNLLLRVTGAAPAILDPAKMRPEEVRASWPEMR